MASNNTIISDVDLKSRLANFGIVCPISNTTRPVLLKKLLKLEKDSLHEQTTQTIDNNYDEKMDTTMNAMDEYEIRDGISKLGYNQVPLTNSTCPLLSNIIKKKLSK